MQKHSFFLAASFPNKAFVFPNNGISEASICCQGWFRKTCTFACVISLKRMTKQQKKITGQYSSVSCEVQVHMQKFNSFRGNQNKA